MGGTLCHGVGFQIHKRKETFGRGLLDTSRWTLSKQLAEVLDLIMVGHTDPKRHGAII